MQFVVTPGGQSLRTPSACVPRLNCPRQFWCGRMLTPSLVITSGRSMPPACE
jgi:hypothetical protein